MSRPAPVTEEMKGTSPVRGCSPDNDVRSTGRNSSMCAEWAA